MKPKVILKSASLKYRPMQRIGANHLRILSYVRHDYVSRSALHLENASSLKAGP